MKRHFLIICIAVLATSSSHAQTCQSLFSHAEKIFNGVAKDYIEFRMMAAEVFVDFIIPGKPGADVKLGELFDKATKMQTDLYRSYGIIAGESNASVGAVNLIIPVKKWSGTLYTERTFIVLQSPYDKVVIKVKKTDGKRGLKMKACAKYADGEKYDDISREIDNGNNTDGVERTFTFEKNMMNKTITLHLVASGGLPSDKCEYTVSIDGDFDREEMKKIAKEEKKNTEDKKKQLDKSSPKRVENSEKLKPAIKNN